MSNEYQLLFTVSKLECGIRDYTYKTLEQIDAIKSNPTWLQLRNSPEFRLDRFIRWISGNQFCKKNYDGEYATLNDILIHTCKNMQLAKPNGNIISGYKAFKDNLRKDLLTASVFENWQRYKQTYRFNKYFTSALMKTDTAKIPVNMLKQLPFDCFHLDFRDTGFDSTDGAFVHVGINDKTGLPTIIILTTYEPKQKPGNIDTETFNFSEEYLRKIHLTVDAKNNQYIYAKLSNSDKQSRMLLFIFQALLYLISNKPDIRKYKKPEIRTARQKQNAIPTLNISDVGVRYGLAIKTAKHGNTVTKSVPGTTRRPITSHMRSGHWHHYWTGHGRTDLIVKWIPPTFVSGVTKDIPLTIRDAN